LEWIRRQHAEIFMRRLILACLIALGLAAPARADDKVIVFAAASLKTALDAAATAFHKDGGPEVSLSYGGSLGLARQLVAGAPADVFISADEPSMDAAAKGAAIKPESRADFLRNHLVVVAPKASKLDKLDLTPAALATALGSSKLATGEVKTVPVGRYAKESLEKLGLWATVEPKLAMTDNVRAALEFVARDEAALGIVYATDAVSEPRVKVVASFPDSTHKPIVYPLAIAAASKNPAAERFVAFLRSPGAAPTFENQGFEIIK
jgi:molybdate transport system substrate-binding protein